MGLVLSGRRPSVSTVGLARIISSKDALPLNTLEPLVTCTSPVTAQDLLYMSDLNEQLERLGLSQYLEVLAAEGFDNWETVLDITESDLSSLNVKPEYWRLH